jgi:5-methyltetrahydropteroyltriglutamate--homocysteine methyltransferase
VIPTEPIGSIPRPKALVDAIAAVARGAKKASELEPLFEDATRDTIRKLEETGSPVITDGEQRKPSFATYPIHGSPLLAAEGGVTIPFADAHTRQLPKLKAGPFKYSTYASSYVESARKHAKKPLKQAVISASALSLLYPAEGIRGYSREDFLKDLVDEAAKDIRKCLDLGVTVQIDFTEARLAIKLDPSKSLLKSFIDLNNRVVGRFSAAERKRLGVHTCPGGDWDSTHSADVDYAELLPELFQLDVGSFFVQLASEKDPERVLRILGKHASDARRVFVGVIDPISKDVESAQKVRDRIVAAAKHIAPSFLGSTDDCGFSPFADDLSTSRDIAFAKIRARVEGNELASAALRA